MDVTSLFHRNEAMALRATPKLSACKNSNFKTPFEKITTSSNRILSDPFHSFRNVLLGLAQAALTDWKPTVAVV